MENKYSAPAVEKMLAIIELLAKENAGCSINEIARLTESPVNTVYRICSVMRDNGYLVNNPQSGHYVLGSKFYFIGKAAERYMVLNNVAKPILDRLTAETGESTQLITMRDDRAVIQLQCETTNPIRIHVETCSLILPHCSAAGKSILAFIDEIMLAKFLNYPLERLTANTISDSERLRAELDTVRETGVSFDREEYMTGLRCVGAPVFDGNGKCVAGIDVIFPVYRISKETEESFVPLVKRAAEDISLGLGYARDTIKK